MKKNINDEYIIGISYGFHDSAVALIQNGQALHAKSLGFIHPANGDFVNFNSKPPEAFRNLLNLLENLSS